MEEHLRKRIKKSCVLTKNGIRAQNLEGEIHREMFENNFKLKFRTGPKEERFGTSSKRSPFANKENIDQQGMNLYQVQVP